MLNCIEQRVHVVAGVGREYECINPEANFRRGCCAREETMVGAANVSVKADESLSTRPARPRSSVMELTGILITGWEIER
jgi:hypothetical protein